MNRPYDQLRALGGLGHALAHSVDRRPAWTAFDQARQLVETLAAQLDDPKLRTSFLNSPLVQEIQTNPVRGD